MWALRANWSLGAVDSHGTQPQNDQSIYLVSDRMLIFCNRSSHYVRRDFLAYVFKITSYIAYKAQSLNLSKCLPLYEECQIIVTYING